MDIIKPILILTAILVLLATLSQRIKISYPVLLVIGGIVIGSMPNLPLIKLAPDVAFLIFLPPLLYEASWKISWSDLKAYRKPISWLAIGLVFLTTTVIAAVAHWFIPGFGWPLAFVLGAIVSPPDAVAATSTLKGLGLPRRLTIILEGESLINDASALIAYKYAVTAVTSSSFVIWEAGFDFLLVAAGGIVVGLAIGFSFVVVLKHIKGNASIETSINLMVPFVSYIIAERLHVSGVLAVVTTGLYASSKSSDLFTSQGRLLSNSFWEVAGFFLNGFVFILIGLQLPVLLTKIPKEALFSLTAYGILISLSVMLIRMIWLFILAYSPFNAGLLAEDQKPSKRELFVVGWAGMRGVVSLATAVAMPFTLLNNQEFPMRRTIIFITFVVILFTLIVQGLTLPYFIRKLNLKREPDHESSYEQALRLYLTRNSISFIEDDHFMQTEHLDEDIKQHLKQRIQHLSEVPIKQTPVNQEDLAEELKKENLKRYLSSELELVSYQKNQINRLLQEERFPEKIIRKLENEMDIWTVALQSRMESIR
ncbi:MAG: Na+/H+ antiporter [Siphonobacter sp.]